MKRDLSSAPGESVSLSPVLSASILDTLVSYLRRLGLTDAALIQQVAEDCLERARRRAAPGSESELLRRALEEAQRRFNQALSAALDIKPAEGERHLAAARAAFLLRSQPLPADDLFRSPTDPHDWTVALAKAMPHNTPPESPLEMHDRPMRFWLFRS